MNIWDELSAIGKADCPYLSDLIGKAYEENRALIAEIERLTAVITSLRQGGGVAIHGTGGVGGESGEWTDKKLTPIWDELSAIGEAAPPGTWDNVPTNLSTLIESGGAAGDPSGGGAAGDPSGGGAAGDVKPKATVRVVSADRNPLLALAKFGREVLQMLDLNDFSDMDGETIKRDATKLGLIDEHDVLTSKAKVLDVDP